MRRKLSIKSKFKTAVFNPKVGTTIGSAANLSLKENCGPKFQKSKTNCANCSIRKIEETFLRENGFSMESSCFIFRERENCALRNTVY